MKSVKIGLLGFGTVGQGVWKILDSNKEKIKNNSGYEVEIKKILVRDKSKPRSVDIPGEILTTNPDDIFNDGDISIVVELMGGLQPAKDYMLRAMKCKKHVVTANKLVIATRGKELFKTAEEEGVLFYYEASVGGGIPVIKGISESLTANKIEQITGIVNGTTNYILTKMTKEGMDFEDALKEAQAMGYAEADPTADVEGYDAAYKLAIMASLSFGTNVDSDSVYREGITKIKAIDIDYAKRFGYVIKLLAIGREEDNRLELKVHPAMVEKNHPIANVNDSFNAILIKGNAVGDLLLYGRGAGDLPTGSAVVGDIISIIRNNTDMSAPMQFRVGSEKKTVKSRDESKSKYYVRLDVKDKPGVLGEIAAIFGENNVNIMSVIQDGNGDEGVNLVFITHDALEGNMSRAIKKIETLNKVNSVENIIRIASFN